jgi:hypothetical protein
MPDERPLVALATLIYEEAAWSRAGSVTGSARFLIYEEAAWSRAGSVTGSARFLVAADYGGGRRGVKVERPADERP